MQGLDALMGGPEMMKMMEVLVGAQMKAAAAVGMSMDEAQALTDKVKAGGTFTEAEKDKIVQFGRAFVAAFDEVKGQLGEMGEGMAAQGKQKFEETLKKIGR